MPTKTTSHSRAAEPTQAVLQDLKALVGDLRDLASNARDRAGDRWGALRQGMRRTLSSTREGYHDLRDATAERLTQYGHAAREHPYRTVGIAAAIGAVLGLLVYTRRR